MAIIADCWIGNVVAIAHTAYGCYSGNKESVV